MSTIAAALAALRPTILSALRIVVGLVLLQFGLSKFFGFPSPAPASGAFPGQLVFSGAMETVGGALLVLGLFTRPVAFLLAGYCAFAYFYIHVPRGFYPVRNGGNLLVLFSFIFLYLASAGGGPISLERLLGRGRSDAEQR